jgi:hypothetical protein
MEASILPLSRVTLEEGLLFPQMNSISGCDSRVTTHVAEGEAISGGAVDRTVVGVVEACPTNVHLFPYLLCVYI